MMADEVQLSDAIPEMELFKEIPIKSFDHRLPHIKQMGNSQEKIKQYVLRDQQTPADQVVIYPELSDQNGQRLSQLLQQRLYSSNSVGLAYVARNLAVAANFVAKPKPDGVLLDVCLITQTKPTVILSIVEEDESNSTAARRYNLSLAKGLNDAIRRFTDQQFSCMYGVITEKDLSEQLAFDNVLSDIKKTVSRMCVSGSLAMSVQKYHKVLQGFLNSIAVTRFVSGADEDASSPWLLTLGQFRILTENVSKKEVAVKAKPDCGGHVLLQEVASRLDKGGPTMLILRSDAEFARKMSLCRHIFTVDEVTEEQNRECLPEVENLVTDCSQREIDKLGFQPKCAWYFCYIRDSHEYESGVLGTVEKRRLQKTNGCADVRQQTTGKAARSLNEQNCDVQWELGDCYAELFPFRKTVISDSRTYDKDTRKRKKPTLNELHKRRMCETESTHKERSVPNTRSSVKKDDEVKRNLGCIGSRLRSRRNKLRHRQVPHKQRR